MIFRGYRGEKRKKDIPHDFLVLCDILEFLSSRLGIEYKFLEYTRNGTLIDDNGGFIDNINIIVGEHEREIGSLSEEISNFSAWTKNEIGGHSNRIDILEKNLHNLRDVITNRNGKISLLEQNYIMLESKIRKTIKVCDKLEERLSKLDGK